VGGPRADQKLRKDVSYDIDSLAEVIKLNPGIRMSEIRKMMQANGHNMSVDAILTTLERKGHLLYEEKDVGTRGTRLFYMSYVPGPGQ
jgi:hypothetical protein